LLGNFSQFQGGNASGTGFDLRKRRAIKSGGASKFGLHQTGTRSSFGDSTADRFTIDRHVCGYSTAP
jgi:hypothetical protein